MKKGADIAIEDINAQGGIKSLGGAKLKLIVFDTGDSVEKAKNAAQRMVAQEPDLVGATGAWLSSFTLAVTEVTERAELPLLTLSYSDLITARGFKYVFQTSPTGGPQANAALPAILKIAESATGKKPKTRRHRHGQHRRAGELRQADARRRLRRSSDSSWWWTRPSRRRSSDATSLIQKVRSHAAGHAAAAADRVPDDKLFLEKLTEFGLGRAPPVISNGAHIGAPELAQDRRQGRAGRRDDDGRQLGRQGPGEDHRGVPRRPASPG